MSGRPGDGARPDVVLIALDCVRADLFDAELDTPGAMPFLQSLRSEVLRYAGAVSTSSWTVPGHASLFTGLYPWDHGAHYRNGPILTREPETVAECLGRAGYATSFFSGNAYVQPSTGLTRGFDQSLWGGGREFYLRFLAHAKATCPNLGGPALVWLPKVEGEARPSKWRDLAMSGFSRVPAVWDGLNRVAGHVRGTYGTTMPTIAPWIEPSLDHWLSSQPRETPVFSFVNLFEAHEPYLAHAGLEVGPADWIRYATCGQDPVLWVRGRWDPTPRELRILVDAYRTSLRVIDRRLASIVGTFRRHRDWENTLFVLTSDHGQAFMEQGTLYHRFRVDEPIARIPLWVRAPGGQLRGEPTAWVSQIDVARTIAEVAGRDSFGDPSSRSLLAPEQLGDDRPVYAMTDGIPPAEIPGVAAPRKAFLDRLEVAVYLGGTKGLASQDGSARATEVARPDRGVAPRPVDGTAAAADAVRLAREAYELATARISAQPYHGTTERRIAGWGY
jgi:arylsulfatase A-like enzyme